MAVPITGIAAFINCVVLFFFYYRLRKATIKGNEFFYLFKNFTIFLGVFYLLFSVPLLLSPENSSLIGWGYLIGHMSAYISLGYLSKISILIVAPSFNRKIIFWMCVLIGVVLTVINLINFNTPTVIDGIVHWNQNPVVGMMIIFFVLTVFIPAATLFIRESFMHSRQQKRYALIGISLLVISIAGPLHDIATVPLSLIIADVVRTLAYLLMLWGVLSVDKTTKKLANKTGV